MDESEIISELKRLRSTDPSYSCGRVLSSVCTQPLDVAVKAFEIFSDTNALDVHVFKSVHGIEKEVISWFAEVFHSKKTAGYVTSGGTESNIAALWAAKKLHPDRKRVLVPESAHYSVPKAADIIGLDVEWIPLDKDFKADVSAIKESIDEQTLAVIATAGTSALGVVDPIEEINGLCEDVFFHVDAAFGGFVLPFLRKGPKADFSLQNVDSITVDPHKMGLVPIPSGVILFRGDSYTKGLTFFPTYLPVKTWTLSGSRPGGAVAATWAAIKYLGVEGYTKIVDECMENTRFLCSELKRIGVEIVAEPEINFVAIRTQKIEEVWSQLKSRDWNILLDSQTGSLRIVVMPHVTREVICNFIADLEGII
ncbi:MAG: tyrosine decarboxylase MfnA [Candidatus Altiarchaeota archaeon]|nr:tyrosine decarboxylase MfnA [Candidatus Altiarchaeota archaeon]